MPPLMTDMPMTAPNWIGRPLFTWMLFCLVALTLYAATGSPRAAAVLMVLEIGFWSSLRYFRNRLRRHR
jgi:hypothetical protein